LKRVIPIIAHAICRLRPSLGHFATADLWH
jgi:hypothetical protein